jgi:hypothetical protein
VQRPPQLDKPICHHFRRQFDPSKAALPIANSFIENKNFQTHPEASLLVPTELGKGVEIFIRTRFQTQPPVYFFVKTTPIGSRTALRPLVSKSLCVVCCGGEPVLAIVLVEKARLVQPKWPIFRIHNKESITRCPQCKLMPQIINFHRFGAFVDILACANRRNATNAEKVCDFLPR